MTVLNVLPCPLLSTTHYIKDYPLTLLFMTYVSDRYAGDDEFADITMPAGGSFADMVALKGTREIGDGINKVIGRLANANDCLLKGVIDQADFNGKSKGQADAAPNALTLLASSMDPRGGTSTGPTMIGRGQAGHPSPESALLSGRILAIVLQNPLEGVGRIRHRGRAMTPETRNVEWKRSWRDEHVAWIRGFANAQGGIPEIGKNDDGRLRLRDGVEGDQAEPTSTQFRVNDENIEIGSSARLPPDRVAEDTGMPSRPHNSRIAQAFFRTRMIEAWGRGIRQITERCREAGNPTPTRTREPGIDSGNDCRARIRRVGSDRAGRWEVGHEGEYG